MEIPLDGANTKGNVNPQHCTVETPLMYVSKPIYNIERGDKLLHFLQMQHQKEFLLIVISLVFLTWCITYLVKPHR